MNLDTDAIPDTERPPAPRPSLIVDVVPLSRDDLNRLVRECGVDAYRFAMLRGLGFEQVCPGGPWVPGERSQVRS